MISAIRFLRQVTVSTTNVSHSGGSTEQGPEVTFEVGEVLVGEVAGNDEGIIDLGVSLGDVWKGLSDIITPFRIYTCPIDSYEVIELVPKVADSPQQAIDRLDKMFGNPGRDDDDTLRYVLPGSAVFITRNILTTISECRNSLDCDIYYSVVRGCHELWVYGQ